MHCVVGVFVGVRTHSCGWGGAEEGEGPTLLSFSHPVAKLEEYVGITVSVCPDFVLTVSCKLLDVL